MTAVSLSLLRGVDGLRNSDFTVGTNATVAGQDFTFSWNQTDQLSKNITRKDIVLALEACIRAVNTGGANIDETTGVIGPP